MLIVCVCDFRMYIPIRRWVSLWTGFLPSIPRGSWYRSTPKPISPRKHCSVFYLTFIHVIWLWTQNMKSINICVSPPSATVVCVRWSTMSSRSSFEMMEQTFAALTTLISATTGVNNFQLAPTKRTTHSRLRQAEEIPWNPALRTLCSSFSTNRSWA